MQVFAHEIGHNFGMPHDTACSVWCSGNPGVCGSGSSCSNCIVDGGTAGNYIMWPYSVDGSQSNNEVFSPCSLYEVRVMCGAWRALIGMGVWGGVGGM